MNILSLDDLTLIAQVIADGSGRAFERLVKKYQSPVRRFFLSQTAGDEMLSDDLAQETFIKVYVNIRSFRQLSSFKTWLFRIAYNVWQDHLRKNSKTTLRLLDNEGDDDDDGVSLNGIQPANVSDGSQGMTSGSFCLDLQTAMGVLNDKERTCITLGLVEDLPIDKIVKITEMPEGTVKSNLSRGKQKLAVYLKQHGYE